MRRVLCIPFVENRIFCLDLLFLLRSEGNVYEAIFQRRYLFIKKSVVLDDKNVIFFEKMSYLLRKCHVFRKNVILHVIKRYAMLYLQKKENRRDSR